MYAKFKYTMEVITNRGLYAHIMSYRGGFTQREHDAISVLRRLLAPKVHKYKTKKLEKRMDELMLSGSWLFNPNGLEQLTQSIHALTYHIRP